MQIQRYRFGACWVAILAILVAGCSHEKTPNKTKSKRDDASSLVEGPEIVRSTPKPDDPANDDPANDDPANDASPIGPSDKSTDDQPDPPSDAKTPGDVVTPIPSDRVDLPPKESDAPKPNGDGEGPKSDGRSEDTPADDKNAKHDSSQFAELISTPYMPVVLLSSAQEKTCLIGMGDQFPKLLLADLTGDQRPLETLYGEKLTVVLFWHPGDRFALEELADLEPLVDGRFGKQGVDIVAINVKGAVERNQDLIAKLSIKYPMLLDPKGDAWRELTRESAGPSARTFLLDATGKVVWFDIEYSRATRRDLVLAIRHHLN